MSSFLKLSIDKLGSEQLGQLTVVSSLLALSVSDAGRRKMSLSDTQISMVFQTHKIPGVGVWETQR